MEFHQCHRRWRQWPIAVPELGLVIVLTGWNIYSQETPVLELIQNHILSAVQDGP